MNWLLVTSIGQTLLIKVTRHFPCTVEECVGGSDKFSKDVNISCITETCSYADDPKLILTPLLCIYRNTINILE